MVLTKDKGFYKSLIALSIPIALQNFITFCVGLADNVMIGTLGDAAVSGVYMGSQVQTLLQIFGAGIEGSMLIIAAQYWGRRDTERIGRIVSIGIRASVIFGLILSVLCISAPKFVISLFSNEQPIIDAGAEYLGILAFSFVFYCITASLIAAMRSVESARIGLWVSLASLIINVALNYVLIFGKLGFSPLGVKGAAIATLVARICECAIIVIYVLFIDKKLKFSLKELTRLDKELLRDFIKYGMPIVAGQIVWAVNMMSNSAIMGRQNAEGVVAGLSIANTMHNLAYVVMNGMAGAVGIITGKTIGEGKESLMREYARTVQVLFLCLGLITGLSVFLLKKPFISMYAVSGAAQAQANSLINVISVTLIGTCYQAACLFGLVKSGGDTAFVFKNDTIFVFLVVLPSAIAATAIGAPAWVVFACLKCDQILKCFVALVKINRFDWMKNLTKGDRIAEN
ncbi:MAG: MATE family efflux transporter [Clostridia bacterium]|nr:MATE family efflux transporter [Clostridia bacterium]